MKDNNRIARLEYQLANLVRTLEAINRHRKYPLERAHYLLLLHLREGPLSVGELATRLTLDNSTVTRQLNAMEKKGLITKQANPADGRSALVVTTATGQELAESMHHLRVQRIEVLLSDWDDKDIDSLTRLIDRLTEALGSSLRKTGSTIKAG